MPSDPMKGFNLLREDKIHLRCPGCGRKQSNMPRDANDPPMAVVAEIFCERCGVGGKDMPTTFLDSNGDEVWTDAE